MEIYRLYADEKKSGIVSGIAKKFLTEYLLIPTWYMDRGILKQGSVIEFHGYDNDDTMRWLMFYDECISSTDCCGLEQCHWTTQKMVAVD